MMTDIILQSEDEVQEGFCAIMEELEYEETKTSDIKPITMDDEAGVPETGDLESIVDIPAMSSFCRLCATQGVDMVSVFDQNKQHPNIVEKIEHCLSITLKKSDILPKQICSVCLRKLELSSQFRKTVRAAEQRLVEFVEQTLRTTNAALRAEVNGHSIHTAQGIGVQTVTNRDKNDNEATDVSEVLKITIASTQSSGTSSNLVSAAEAHDLCVNNRTSESRTENQAIIDSANSKNTSKTVVEQSTLEVTQRFNEKIFGSQPTSSDTTSSHKFSKNVTKRTEDNADDDNFLDETTVVNRSYPIRRVGRKIVKCKTCGEAFRTIKDCYTHSSIHFSMKYYPCSFCHKIFLTESRWRKHNLQHTNGKTLHTKEITHDFESSAKSLYCNKCNSAMDSEISLRQHILTAHNQPIVFRCNVCKKVFRSEDGLNVHKEDQDCSLKCTICKKKFKSKDALSNHRKSCQLQVHLCAYCGKSYSRKWNLKVHMRIHNGEKLFSCDICKAEFTVSNHFKQHKGTHSKRRLYRCSLCDKDFKSDHDKYRHEKIHTVGKPYQSDLCKHKCNRQPNTCDGI